MKREKGDGNGRIGCRRESVRVKMGRVRLSLLGLFVDYSKKKANIVGRQEMKCEE